MEYVITFKNTNFAVKAEQCLLQQSMQVSVMPLPAQISAGCGICLRVLPENIQPTLNILSAEGIYNAGIYSRIVKDKKSVYAKITDGDI